MKITLFYYSFHLIAVKDTFQQMNNIVAQPIFW